MCNACGFLCCGSDEFGGCGCYHCGEPECLRLCEFCGENECDGFCQSSDDDGYWDAAEWQEPEFTNSSTTEGPGAANNRSGDIQR